MHKEFLGGLTNTTLHFETDGTMHVEEKQDCESILEYTKAARNNRFDADWMGGDSKHVGEVPMTLFIAECQKRGIPADLGHPQADAILMGLIRGNPYLQAAPTLRDSRIIIKGAR